MLCGCTFVGPRSFKKACRGSSKIAAIHLNILLESTAIILCLVSLANVCCEKLSHKLKGSLICRFSELAQGILKTYRERAVTGVCEFIISEVSELPTTRLGLCMTSCLNFEPCTLTKES